MPTRGIITDRDPGGGRPVAAERAWAARAPAHDNRRALDGILWVPRTDAPWRDLPGAVGKWNSVFLRFSRWTKAGLWDAMLHVLTPLGLADHAHHSVDSTSVRAHRCTSGAAGGTAPAPWAARAAATARRFVRGPMPEVCRWASC